MEKIPADFYTHFPYAFFTILCLPRLWIQWCILHYCLRILYLQILQIFRNTHTPISDAPQNPLKQERY
jgi:hypothetical protein